MSSNLVVDHYTKCPNFVADEWLRYLSGSETKVISFIVRRFCGWAEPDMVIGGTEIAEATGLSLRTVKEAVKSLKEVGALIVRTDDRDGLETNAYRLNIDWHHTVTGMLRRREDKGCQQKKAVNAESAPVREVHGSKVKTGADAALPPVQNLHPLKESEKIREKDNLPQSPQMPRRVPGNRLEGELIALGMNPSKARWCVQNRDEEMIRERMGWWPFMTESHVEPNPGTLANWIEHDRPEPRRHRVQREAEERKRLRAERKAVAVVESAADKEVSAAAKLRDVEFEAAWGELSESQQEAARAAAVEAYVAMSPVKAHFIRKHPENPSVRRGIAEALRGVVLGDRTPH